MRRRQSSRIIVVVVLIPVLSFLFIGDDPQQQHVEAFLFHLPKKDNYSAQRMKTSTSFHQRQRRRGQGCKQVKTLVLRESLSDFESISSKSMLSSSSNNRVSRMDLALQELQWIVAGIVASLAVSLLVISWEDMSLSHPMRSEVVLARTNSATLPWGHSTVRGMAFGKEERLALTSKDANDYNKLESSDFRDLPSYNEVMLQHRAERVPLWHHQVDAQGGSDIARSDVEKSVWNIQRAVLKLQECKILVQDYEWDKVDSILNHGDFRATLDASCYLLQQADDFVSLEARQVVGFDWGSCAWRHCGALADTQEALDEIEHLLGVLEPFECMFCLDIVERSLRDILAVTADFQSPEIQSQIPAYQPLQRMSDVNQDNLDGFDMDFIKTLDVVKNLQAD